MDTLQEILKRLDIIESHLRRLSAPANDGRQRRSPDAEFMRMLDDAVQRAKRMHPAGEPLRLTASEIAKLIAKPADDKSVLIAIGRAMTALGYQRKRRAEARYFYI